MEKKHTIENDFRYEKKVIIPELSLYEIEHMIKHHPAIFSEIFHKRSVNNIYFDSINLESYHDNLAGVSERTKIRIRWYGKMFGLIMNPILEIKIKKNELGKKLHFKLKDFILDKNFSLKLLQKEVFAKSRLPKWLIEKLKFVSPSLLSSYKRKYFCSADKTHRITLDNDLKFFKIKNKNNSFKGKMIERNIHILEIKYSIEHAEKTSNITQCFPFRLTANSKYVYGINLLNL